MLVFTVALVFLACERGPESAQKSPSVVVYCSVDEGFARPILDEFGARSGINIRAVFDSEAGKTTGLVQRIVREAESGRVNADVFWSGEVFNTVLLARKGLLETYASPAAVDIPERFKDPKKCWTGYAARARVIAFDPLRTPRDQVPQTWDELASAGTAGRLSLANPLFGTTRGQAAAFFALWGEDRGRRFLQQLRDGGVQIADGNSATVRAVIAGRADFAATDSDDVWVAQRSGASVDMVYPRLGGGGTLIIPCTVAILKGCPDPEEARKLVDFLISAKVERRLGASDAKHFPVREALRAEMGVPWPPESVVDYDAVADSMDAADRAVREVLIQ